MMIEKGANLRSKKIGSPLPYAAAKGNLSICRKLQAAGIDPSEHYIDNGGYNPTLKYVHTMCHNENRMDTIRYLVEEAKVDVSEPDKYGMTVLHDAAHFGDIEMVRYFVSHGANVNATSQFNETPLD